MNEYIKYC